MTNYGQAATETLHRWLDGAWWCNDTRMMQEVSDELHRRGVVQGCACPQCVTREGE